MFFKHVFKTNDTVFTKMMKISDTVYQIASVSGLYTTVNRDGNLGNMVYKNDYSVYDVGFIGSFSYDQLNTTYMYSSGGVLFSSTNGKTYTELLRLDDGTINDVMICNGNEYNIASTDGIYRTEYRYTMQYDSGGITVSEVKRIFDSSVSDMTERVQDEINVRHISEDHGKTSTITFINDNAVGVDMKYIDVKTIDNVNLDDGQEFPIVDDVVNTIDTNDTNIGEAVVEISNFLTSDTDIECKYIVKRFTSGINEMYIHIPTTDTYYISHVHGSQGCSLYDVDIEHQNIRDFGADVSVFKGSVKEHFTRFNVIVNGSEYDIQNVIGVQVNGTSLPLKVYRDQQSATSEGVVALLYHSPIMQSQSLNNNGIIERNDEGDYVFRFACFGTDEQSVKITFLDTHYTSRKNKYRILFHPNGSKGRMLSQYVDIGVNTKLRRNAFRHGGDKQFLGWTTSLNPSDNQTCEYIDESYIMKTAEQISDGETINLYAVWSSSVRDNSETVLAMNDAKGEVYIDGGDILEHPTLGKTTMIKYQ